MKINSKILMAIFAAAVFSQNGLHAFKLVIDGYGDETESNKEEQAYFQSCSDDDDDKEEKVFHSPLRYSNGKDDDVFSSSVRYSNGVRYSSGVRYSNGMDEALFF